MRKIFENTLLLTLLLAPLLGIFRDYGYEQTKVIFFIFITTFAGICWLLIDRKTTLRIRWTPIKIVSALFVLILGITSAFGINPAASVLGLPPYFQGWIVYLYLFLFAVFVSESNIKLEKWAWVFTVSAFLVSLLALDQYIRLNFLHQYVPNYAGRVVSTFGQPNFYSGFLLLSLPFITQLFSFWKKRWVVVVILLVSGAIIVSGSRASIIILLLSVYVWLIQKIPVKRVGYGIVILSIVLLGYFSLNPLSNLVKKEVYMPQQNQWLIDNAPEKRVLIWQTAVLVASEKLVTGFGLENIGEAISNFKPEKTYPAYFGLKELWVDRTHNYMFDLIFFSGIPGLLAWCLLVLFAAKKLWRRPVFFVSLLFYLVWVQLQNQSIVHMIYFWFLIGLSDQKKELTGVKG